MTIRAYYRCNSGHYFRTEACPFDGWWSMESVELGQAVERLAADGKPPSLDTMREAGIAPNVLKRTVVIEFGDDATAFEALSTEGYVIEGRWFPSRNLGPYHSVLG